jgi:hypothetical protein
LPPSTWQRLCWYAVNSNPRKIHNRRFHSRSQPCHLIYCAVLLVRGRCALTHSSFRLGDWRVTFPGPSHTCGMKHM